MIVTGFIFIRSFSTFFPIVTVPKIVTIGKNLENDLIHINPVTITPCPRLVPGLSSGCPGAVTVSVTGTKKLLYTIDVSIKIIFYIFKKYRKYLIILCQSINGSSWSF